MLSQAGVHVRQLSHGAQELDGLEVSHRLQELVLPPDQLVERLGGRRLVIADLLLEPVAAAVGRKLDLGKLGIVVTILKLGEKNSF